MADQQVIREFLVKLGFRQDEASLKKFTNGVEGATKNVVKLVAAIQGASLTIAAGVTAFASNLEKMYFAAKRAGSSATSLKAIETAMQNINGSGEEALASIQALSGFIRSQPGAVGFLKALGVDALDASGNMRDMADIMVDIGRAMRDKPFYLAKQQAGMLGISEEALRAMLDPKFEDQLRKQQKLLMGSGFDKAAEDANKFMERVRELTTLVQVMAVRIQDALMNKLGMSMEQVTQWFRDHGDEIAKKIAAVLMTLLDIAEKIIPAVSWLIDKFIELDAATDGWSTKIIVLVAALNMLGASSLIGGVMGLAGAMGALAAPILAIAAAAAGGAAIGSWINSIMPEHVQDKLGRNIAKMMAALGSEDAQRALDDEKYAKTGVRPGTSGKNAPAAGKLDPMRFFMSMGWTKEQAAGIVANLQAESKMDPYAQGDGGKAYGIAQWHPDRQANFEKWAGHNIQNSTLEEQLRFVNYELTQGAEKKAGNLLRASTNARQAGAIVSRNYERPLRADQEASARGAQAVQIAQTTEININGAADPNATANAVQERQKQVNADLTRNMSVALR
jgi:hypothetical protein